MSWNSSAFLLHVSSGCVFHQRPRLGRGLHFLCAWHQNAAAHCPGWRGLCRRRKAPVLNPFQSVWGAGGNLSVWDLCRQVKENEKKTQLGILRLPLSRFINVSNMMLDQRFLLEQSAANSQIKLKATLRVGDLTAAFDHRDSLTVGHLDPGTFPARNKRSQLTEAKLIAGHIGPCWRKLRLGYIESYRKNKNCGSHWPVPKKLTVGLMGSWIFLTNLEP